MKLYNVKYVAEPHKTISTDEKSVMKLLARADDQFCRRLKGIWGTNKISTTSCPLILMASPWLLDSAPLPVDAKSNPVWHNILTVTNEKLNVWIQRVDGRFNNLIEDTVRKGKKPSLGSYSAQYRDNQPVMVWRTCCAWVACQPMLKNMFSAEELEKKFEQFCKGLLDGDFKDKVQVLDPSFSFDDLRFIRMAAAAKQDADQDVTHVIHEAEKSKALAEVNLFHAKLLGEQSVWAEYLAKARGITDATQSELTLARETAQVALETAVRNHVETFFTCINVPSRSEFPASAENALYKFMEQFPAHQGSAGNAAAYRVDIYNLAAMGPQQSTHLKDIIVHAAEAHIQHPARSVSLFFLPNAPAWGAGGGGRLTAAEFREHAAQAADDARKELMQKGIHSWECKEIAGIFDAENFYSPERKLRVDFIMAISGSRGANSELISEFVKSSLWKREAVAGPIKALPRTSFKDWSKHMDIASDQARDANVDRRQWLSGMEFYSHILTRLFEGTQAHPRAAGHVREWSMYDDSPALACMNINMEKSQAMPFLAWTGMTWNNFIRANGGKVVQANVFVSVCDTLAFVVKDGKYSIPGFLPSATQRITAAPQLPAPPTFELGHPRDHELPLKQTVLDEILSKARLAGADTKDLVQSWLSSHDKKYNPSGQPFRGNNKRPAEESLTDNVEARAINVPPRPNVMTLDDLKKAGPVHELKQDKYSLFASQGWPAPAAISASTSSQATEASFAFLFVAISTLKALCS